MRVIVGYFVGEEGAKYVSYTCHLNGFEGVGAQGARP